MGMRGAVTSRVKRLVRRMARPFGPPVGRVLGRVDTHLVAVSSEHFRDAAVRLDEIDRRVDDVIQMLHDANAPIEAVQDVRRTLVQLRAMVLGLAERVHSQQVVLAELTFRLERLAGASLDATALERRLQNLEDHILTRRD
jgi:hypothetical protein